MITANSDIIRENLLFHMDPVDQRCYSRAGDKVYNLAAPDFNGLLSVVPSWNPVTGCFDLDGSHAYVLFDGYQTGSSELVVPGFLSAPGTYDVVVRVGLAIVTSTFTISDTNTDAEIYAMLVGSFLDPSYALAAWSVFYVGNDLHISFVDLTVPDGLHVFYLESTPFLYDQYEIGPAWVHTSGADITGLSSQFTCMVWARWLGAGNVMVGSLDATYNRGWFLQLYSDNVVYAGVCDTSFTYNTYSEAPQAEDSWFCLTMVFDGAAFNQVRCFMNGGEMGPASIGGGYPLGVPDEGRAYMEVGFLKNYPISPTQGSVGDVLVYAAAHTPEQVLANYEATRTKYGI